MDIQKELMSGDYILNRDKDTRLNPVNGSVYSVPRLEQQGFANPIKANTYGRWQEDWKDLGAMEKVGAILSVGSAASAGLARSLVNGDGNAAINIWNALTLQDRRTYVDLLQEHDVKWAPVLGLVLDIGLDPVTWITGPVGVFKSVAKKAGVDVALQASKRALLEIEPISKMANFIGKPVGKIMDNIGEKVNFYHGTNKELFDLLLMKKYGMTQDLVDHLAEWNTFSKTISPELGKQMSLYKVGAPNTLKQFNEYQQVLTKWDDLTQRALKLGLISETAITKHMDNGLSMYLPQVTKGWLNDGWSLGKSLMGPTKMPGFSFNRALKIKDKDFIPFMDELSGALREVAKKDNIGEILSTAEDLAVKMNKNNPFAGQFTEMVRDTVTNHSGVVGKVRGHLHSSAEYFTPIDNIVDLGKVYEADLIKFAHKKAIKDFVFDSAESVTHGWAKKFNAEMDLVGQTVFATKDNIDSVARLIKTVDKKGEFKILTRDLEFWTTNHIPTITNMAQLEKPLATRLSKALKKLNITADTSLYSVSDEVAHTLTRVKDLVDPASKQSGELLKFYDKTLRHWTKLATVVRLPFHQRNFVSNTALAFLGGVEPWEIVQDSVRAGTIQKGSKEIIKIGKISKTAEEWRSLFGSVGIRGFGQVGEVMDKNFVDATIMLMNGREPKTILGKTLDAAYGVGEKFGKAIEDNSRIMVAINRLEKNGGNIEDAARHVWKYMIQYDQLTPWEKNVGKRIIPFYAWMRKNIPLQISEFVNSVAGVGVGFERAAQTRQSMLFKGYHDLFQHWNPETPEEHKFKPAYMKDYGYFKLPDGIKKGFEKALGLKENSNAVYVHLDLPNNALADMAKGPMGLVSRIMTSLSPYAFALQLGFNVKAFPEPYTPIERFKGELKPIPSFMALLPEATWKMLRIEPMRDPKSGRMVLGAPVKAIEATFGLLPGLQEVTKMFPQSKAFIEQEGVPWRVLKYATGINFTPVDKEQERYYWALKSQNKIRQAMKLMVQKMKPLTTEELRDLVR